MRPSRHTLVALVVTLAAATLTGCYTVGFNTLPPQQTGQLGFRAEIEIPPETLVLTHSVRSAAAGIGNRFTIRVGEVLSQYAHAYLPPAFPAGPDIRIRITANSFDIHDFEAHLNATIVVTRGDSELFNRSYQTKGTGHFAQVVWGGVFAMKSSMRKTTDEALRQLFETFLVDARREQAGW